MLFSPVYASSESGFQPGRRGDCPRTMLARYAVPPSPSLASGPQVLLLSKLKAPINHAESTLLQVLILKQLKVPLESITFEKPGQGSPLWLTNCSKRVSVGKVRGNPNLPSSVHSSKFRIPQPLYLPLLRKHPGVGVFFPFWNHLYRHSRVQREICFFFLATRHPPLATFFPNASSTGAATISRTRSRKAGTSSFVKPLVSMVSCK